MLDSAGQQARRRQPDPHVDKAGLGVRVVSDMGQSPQDVLKKRNRPNARQTSTSAPPGSSLSYRGHGYLCTSSSGYLRGIPASIIAWSHNEGCRYQFGVTFLDPLGSMDMHDLLELSKGLSKIGAKIFEGLWLKFRTSKSPYTFLDKHESTSC